MKTYGYRYGYGFTTQKVLVSGLGLGMGIKRIPYLKPTKEFTFLRLMLIISTAYVIFDKQNELDKKACKNGFKPFGFIPNLLNPKITI